MEEDDDTRNEFMVVWNLTKFSEWFLNENWSSEEWQTKFFPSPRFTVDSLKASNWSLTIFDDAMSKNKFLCSLKREKGNDPQTIEIEYELSLLYANGSRLIIGKRRTAFEEGDSQKMEFPVNKSDILENGGSDFLESDTLTVFCRIWAVDGELGYADVWFLRTDVNVDREHFSWIIPEISSLPMDQEMSFLIDPKVHVLPRYTLFLNLTDEGAKVRIVRMKNYANVETETIWEVSATETKSRAVKKRKIQMDGETEFENILKQESPQLTKERVLSPPDDALVLSCCCLASFTFRTLYRNRSSANVEENMNSSIVAEPKTKDNVPFSNTTLMNEPKSLCKESVLCDSFPSAGSFPILKENKATTTRKFRATCVTDTVERPSDEVELPDLDSDKVRKMMKFICKYREQVEFGKCCQMLLRC